MPIRSMTGYAQVRSLSASTNGSQPGLAFTVSLKSVNHRYLDIQTRMPSEFDALEVKIRRLLKEKMVRGHVDVTLSVERSGPVQFQINRELVLGYVQAYRDAAKEAKISVEPDLNAILKQPGALSGGFSPEMAAVLEAGILICAEKAVEQLNAMRTEEGRGIEQELRRCMTVLSASTAKVATLRQAVTKAYLEKVRARMQELIGDKADPDRILQEAALLAERSDVQEEIVRLQTHIQHFLGLLDQDGEAGKKLDFLLQEMNREANTLLSKTSGVVGEGQHLTELGLAMKSEIEKAREQAQNVE